jgi:CHAT domain-containing protein/Tfp pilus assembly protein PilF
MPAQCDRARVIVLRIIGALALAMLMAVAPTRSPAQNLAAQEQRFFALYEARNFQAALVEAQKLQAAVVRRHGEASRPNAVAIEHVADCYSSLDRNGEAIALYTRALAIWKNESQPDMARVGKLFGALGRIYERQAHYKEAIESSTLALQIQEKLNGPNDASVASTLTTIGLAQRKQGNYDQAEATMKRALAIRQQVYGVNHPQYADSLVNLGNVYWEQARYAEGEEALKRALAIYQQAYGPAHPDVGMALNNLGRIYGIERRDLEAEFVLKRALAVSERALGGNHRTVADTLANLGNVLSNQGRMDEVEGLYKRAGAIYQQIYGANHPSVAAMLNNLAMAYRSLERYAEAEPLVRRAVAINEQFLGPTSFVVATNLSNLALILQLQGRPAEAEPLFKRALTNMEGALGPNHPALGAALVQLADDERELAHYDDAERLLQRALALRAQTVGADHPEYAVVLNYLAKVERARGNAAAALAWSRKAVAVLIARATAGKPSAQRRDAESALDRLSTFFQANLLDLSAAAVQGKEPAPALAREGFGVAQWALQSAAADAIGQMAARLAAGGGAIAGAARQGQDLVALRQGKDAALLAQLSKPAGQQNAALIERLRTEIADIDRKLADYGRQIERDFPEFADLATPRPLKADEAQRLLAPDEALVYFLVGGTDSYVFALTREQIGWSRIALGADAMADKVAQFRHGLDVDMTLDQATLDGAGKKRELFDLGTANALYETLFGSVDALVRGKRHLMIVPSGALTALPFHLLTTAKPAVARPAAKDQLSAADSAPYREAAWLIRRQSVTVLPAVASLKALRVHASKAAAAKPLIAFADPVFGAEAPAAQRRAKPSRSVASAAYSEFWQGAAIDPARLAQSLPRLADTADEVTTVARQVGAAAADIKLRGDASELAVKRAPLADYRIVYFATHGLVAGDIKGVAEPSLALTIPARPTPDDDGLLTASEVAQLKLNADWVVLSACNTIAGGKPGAEALSGLARAFFYAGARALLVSHWAVASDAATRLTIATFDVLKSDPSLGRAEALRRAMLAYLDDTSQPVNSYPAIWGPFSIIGEGGAR